MKGPLIATGAVLLVGVFLGWQRQSQVSVVADELGVIYQQAERNGKPLQGKTSASRRGSVLSDRDASSLVDEVANLLRRAEIIEKSGGSTNERMRDKMVDLSVQLMELSPEQLRKVLESLSANDSISDFTKSEIIGMSILYISSDHPQEALRLLEESLAVLGQVVMTDNTVSSALESWAGRDPSAALNWIKSAKELPPGVNREELVHAVLDGAAGADPANAFRMLPSLDLKDYAEASGVIASAVAGSQVGRDNLIQGMRDCLAEFNDPAVASQISSSVMETLGQDIGRDSFEEMTGWLESKSFTSEELASFADGLNWSSTGEQTGEWLAWITDHVNSDQLAAPVESLMGDWVEEDYLSAGQWLSSAPAGPAKAPAVMSYAEAVAAYDPEVATQWAMTLTDEQMKQKTLQSIYDNWPDGDDDAAARFAAQHGLD